MTVRNERYTPGVVKSYIEDDGMEYFLTSYTDLEDIPDDELRNACIEARDAIEKVNAILKPYEADYDS